MLVEYNLATKTQMTGHVLRNEVLQREITEGRMKSRLYHGR